MAGNGGIIGPVNVTSRGKNTVTIKTSSGCDSLQSGTRIIKTAVVAGGGGGGGGYSGGGAGGLQNIEINASGSVPTVVGGGGATVSGGCTANQGSDGGVSSLAVSCSVFSSLGASVSITASSFFSSIVTSTSGPEVSISTVFFSSGIVSPFLC